MDLESINTSKLFVQFKPLIHKTLNDLKINKNNMDYEDFYQELQVHLLTIKSTFQGDIFNSDIDRYKFTSYARQGLYWFGLNLIRRDKNLSFPMDECDLEWMSFENEQSPPEMKTLIYLEEFFQLAKDRLTDEEYLLLLYLSEDIHTVSDIAVIFDVSRDTIYQRKKHIQKKLYNIKELIIH